MRMRIKIMLTFFAALTMASLFNTFLLVWTEQGERSYKFSGYMITASSLEWDSVLYSTLIGKLNCDNHYSKMWCDKIQQLYVAGSIFTAIEIGCFALACWWSWIIICEERGSEKEYKQAFGRAIGALRILGLALWCGLSGNSFFQECKDFTVLHRLVPFCFGIGFEIAVVILALSLPLINALNRKSIS